MSRLAYTVVGLGVALAYAHFGGASPFLWVVWCAVIWGWIKSGERAP